VIRGRSFISLVLFSGYAKWSASEPQANIGQVHPVFPAVPTGRWRPDGADLTVATGRCCPVGAELRGTKAAALAACARNIHMPLIFSL
jgi:hypothetical protein